MSLDEKGREGFRAEYIQMGRRLEIRFEGNIDFHY